MSALHDWTAAALAGRLIKVPDPGLMMDTTHVSDVAAAVVKILLADSPHYPIYNVGAEEEHSVGEILRTMEELVPDSSYTVDRSEDWTGRRNFVVGGHTRLTRLYADLGFTHAYPLRTGLKQYLDWRRAYKYFD